MKQDLIDYSRKQVGIMLNCLFFRLPGGGCQVQETWVSAECVETPENLLTLQTMVIIHEPVLNENSFNEINQ